MSQYNWSNLSDHDFEAVCRDILSASLRARFESFARGADGGIDLRAEVDDQLVIGQSKHYQASGVSKLIASLRKEREKLEAMSPAPDRYIVLTTAALTPANKREIVEVCAPFLKAEADVWGPGDIEGALAANPTIEAQHFKLWLSSVRVLGQILGNATLGRSSARLEEIARRARLFVAHSRLPEAERILHKEHSLIISGPPGIGKTTLAEMLALRLGSAGFVVHFVAEVSEIEALVGREEKQLFVYDDFLGRTNFRDTAAQSTQERLFAMIRHVRSKPNKYLVMTTREYIYQEARTLSERMAQGYADEIRCILDVRGYNRMSRAEILYNHLFWTDGIAKIDLQDFVGSKGYMPIIAHPNFNPRWIADALDRIAARTEEGSEGPQ